MTSLTTQDVTDAQDAICRHMQAGRYRYAANLAAVLAEEIETNGTWDTGPLITDPVDPGPISEVTRLVPMLGKTRDERPNISRAPRKCQWRTPTNHNVCGQPIRWSHAEIEENQHFDVWEHIESDLDKHHAAQPV